LLIAIICIIYSKHVSAGFFGANLAAFAVGFASYYFYQSDIANLPLTSVRIFFGVVLAFSLVFAHTHIIGIGIWLAVFYAVVSARRSPAGGNIVTKTLLFRPISYLGQISYSVYMVHMQVIFGLMWCFNALHIPVSVQYLALPIGCLAGAIVVASVVHHTIEAPFHSFGQKLSRLTKPAVSAA
jgi:peptidoglycan/LPS O-acetylase OafA/YrhL